MDDLSSSFSFVEIPPKIIGSTSDQVEKRKLCNCKRSNCLKLYCECFASGVYCRDQVNLRANHVAAKLPMSVLLI